MSLQPAPSSHGLVHAVSLPAYFADGFRLVTASSPFASRHHTGDKDPCTAAAGSTAPQLCSGFFGYTAGGKRRRSSMSCTSTQAITPSSEFHGETVEANHVEEAVDDTFSPAHTAEGSLLLVPTATSLTRLGPSGSWLNSPPPNAPEEGSNAAVEAQPRISPHSDGGSKKANMAELASLLHPALLECYRAEDEQLQRRREEATREEGTRLCATVSTTEERLGRAVPRSCHASSPASPGVFERTLVHIEAQKRRRREQSERLEAQVREIARVKELPILVEDAVRYAQQLVEWSGKGGGSSNMRVCHTEAGTVHPDEATVDNNRLPAVTTPLCAASDSREASQMLYAKFPPPLFHTSSFAAGVGRLLRWVRTWQRAMPRGAAAAESPHTKKGEDKKQCDGKPKGVGANKMTKKAVLKSCAASCPQQGRQRRGQLETGRSGILLNEEVSEGENDNDRASMAVNRKNDDVPTQKRTALQRYHDDWMRMADRMLGGRNGHIVLTPVSGGSPLEPREETEYGLASDRIMYDEYGNRLRSVRLAKKMAEKRALHEEAQKVKEQQRGYFARAEEGTRSIRRALFDEVSDSGSEDASDDSSDDVTNIAVLHGPCGVGKTAIVYLVAEILGYRVVEMNTSVRRCPKNIDRLLSEVTRSRRLSDLATGRAMISIEEELKKLKNEHASSLAAAAAAAASASASAVKEKNGKNKRKGNGISAEAVAEFFRPRVKAETSEVVMVDADSTAATVEPSHEVRVLHAAVKDRYGKCKGKTTANMDATLATEGAPACGSPEDTTRTLLLFEDADVILGDEAMKPFYAAVRDLAKRSKVPIVVTMSSTASMSSRPAATPAQDAETVQTVPMDAAQVSHLFGKRTAFTAVEPMSRSALFTQLLLVAAVEQGLVVVQRGAPFSSNEKDEGDEGLHRETATEPALSATSPELVLVRDVGKFQRLADVIRREVYKDDMERPSRLLCNTADVRRWLNRLQYLRLVEQWPTPATLCDSRHDKCVVGEVCMLSTQLEAWNDVMEVAGIQSHWDTQLGRVLRVPAYAGATASSTWEWQQFQYAEEIAADANVNCTWGDGVFGETHGSSSNSSNSGDVVPKTETDASAATGLAEVLQSVVPNDGFIRPKQRGGVEIVDAMCGGCTTTTRERIDAFGAWWQRTRKTDAIKSFVVARSSTAYEDVIGFGCLLQQSSIMGKGPNG
ncbi:hypothetical protein TraAM80_04036 [Trypanosoma rangeli]|uniref:ATPase AAA-type core domain-containing protein n=1 Tax=Trypanosoma rangeli TaxID=5698 RepID=A0A422NLV2_TRYRA|nr:uncharacterized protein TraAM80_04036 [Trypanosoma rangeli]RNF06339.1 hypothetical protein TraAM80_04036 [Trypanosoma rangeli]|eukprot:RNF06339.1 hypothetical protein TraAM80_04036 [Trypanosoma rangeli]